MERLHFDDTSPEIEVLDGQMSVEELLAELGLDWHAESAAASSAGEAGDAFSQPALF
jgi:glutamyl/glutaminyl-tRNA synthetase